jgi:hypothetical protein
MGGGRYIHIRQRKAQEECIADDSSSSTLTINAAAALASLSSYKMRHLKSSEDPNAVF